MRYRLLIRKFVKQISKFLPRIDDFVRQCHETLSGLKLQFDTYSLKKHHQMMYLKSIFL